jgi:hypothetical protein
MWFETYLTPYGDVARLDADGDLIPCEGLPGAPVVRPTDPNGGGYLMVESNGSTFGFGDVRTVLPVGFQPTTAVAMVASGGYWLLGQDGVVHARGLPHHGNAAVPAGDRVSSIAALPDASGYWVFTTKGRALAFGAAKHFGDMAGTPLNGAIVASAVTPSGRGYWMVGSDGGIFTFGDAQFSGSTGDLRLNEPVVGIAPDPDGGGYWLVASDGGIFAFDADFRGSVPEHLQPGQRLNRPVIGAIAYGDGYLMVASDGGIFAFSNRPFLGSLGSTPPSNPIVGVAVR